MAGGINYLFILCFVFLTLPLSASYRQFSRHILYSPQQVFRLKDSRRTSQELTNGGLNQLFFDRFAKSVATESSLEGPPATFSELIRAINNLARNKPPIVVSDTSKRILVNLFPRGLLPAYRFLFAPFPRFSAWMNTWVTWFATQWLMGKSTVADLQLSDGSIAKEQLLLVEKCKFLEESGCVRTCLHACKIPTERFFMEEMGLPVYLRPNFTDFSCRFEFNVKPLPIQLDPEVHVPCLLVCSNRKETAESYNCGL